MENKLQQLTSEEQRVLGALIEKSKTTPDYYPLTLNSLVTVVTKSLLVILLWNMMKKLLYLL